MLLKYAETITGQF